MGAGKSSLVLRFVKGQFFDFQARFQSAVPSSLRLAHWHLQESTIGAAFLTQTVSVNDATVKFEIWHVPACGERTQLTDGAVSAQGYRGSGALSQPGTHVLPRCVQASRWPAKPSLTP